MTNDVKAAVERFRKSGATVDSAIQVSILFHIDGEDARTAAAVAAAREEQRRACAEIPQHIAYDDGQWQDLHEYVIGCPLTATPLADRIAELERELQTAVRLFEQEQGLAVEAQERALEAEGNARVSRVGVNLSMHVAMVERAEKAEAERDRARKNEEYALRWKDQVEAERDALREDALNFDESGKFWMRQAEVWRAQVEAARAMLEARSESWVASILTAMDGAKP